MSDGDVLCVEETRDAAIATSIAFAREQAREQNCAVTVEACTRTNDLPCPTQVQPHEACAFCDRFTVMPDGRVERSSRTVQ